MGDEIHDAMERALPTLRKAVANGMSSAQCLDKLVRVTTETDPTPLRVSRWDWTDPADGLRQAKPQLNLAYEFSCTRALTLASLEPGLDPEDSLRNFGFGARTGEVRAVLSLIASAGAPRPFNAVALRSCAEKLPEPCRFLGPTDPAVADLVTLGVIEEAVKVTTEMPEDTRGLLVSVTSGPVVRRLVDDLTLTWSRTTTPTRWSSP